MNKKRVSVLALLLLCFSLVLFIQGCKRKTPTPTETPLRATPTATAQPLPPALVETDPLPGAQIALKNPITFYFNQPMDRRSVEGAVKGEPTLSGSFAWQDDSSLTFTPDSPLLPGTSLAINIAESAQSAKGMSMLQPVSLSYVTSDYLKLVQSLPTDNATEVNPTSAVAATFNQPVVPLGADPANLPVGFSLSPAADGRGEWINTSTYIFYPQPALNGGISYQVTINPDLTSTAGSSMKDAAEWSFSTAMPRLVSVEPIDGLYNVRLDASVKLNFSYSMDATSVQENFSLVSNGDPVKGQSSWNDDFTTFTFTPTTLLQRDASYSVVLNADAAALGGTPMGEAIRSNWNTVPELMIYGSDPSEGGTKLTYQNIKLFLSSYISTKDFKDRITIDPSVPNFDAWMDENEMSLNFWGTFDPDTDYTLTVSPDWTDLWGSRLGETYTLHFRSGPLDPAINLPYTSDANFLTTHDRGLLAQVTNISQIQLSIGTLSIDDLVEMYRVDGYQFREDFVPQDVESWTFYPEVPANRATTVTIPVAPDGEPRAPGLYFLRFPQSGQMYMQTVILAVSHYQATLKMTPDEAFLWAVDLETNEPAARLPVMVIDQSGVVMARGTTDEMGIFQSPTTTKQEPYNATFAVLGTPGEDDFGFVFASWSDGLSPWDFDINANFYPQPIKVYAYTDRPIYRPGDTVHFRVAVRQVSNGRYSLPDLSSYKLNLTDTLGQVAATFDLPLSGFGTASGEYNLPSDAQPGTYSLVNPDTYDGVYFDVANYRKPDINLEVEFESTEVLSGTVLAADVNARYFFDAPAGNMPLHWVLYSQNSTFNIPNYQVGPVDTGWLDLYSYPYFGGGLGNPVEEGDAKTDADGLYTLKIPAPANQGRQKYTLEVTLTDESGLPVSGRSSLFVNPAEYYIGVHPDAWSFAADSEAGFDILTLDLKGDPSAGRRLTAKFQSVVWIRHDPDPSEPNYMGPSFVPEYTPVASEEIVTNPDGKARVTFTPPEAGAYQLDVYGDGTLTQVIVWVSGKGTAIWPSLPNQRLRLVADKDEYLPGDTAQVFVPNPFGSTAFGLLTIERGEVMRYQRLQLEPGGSTIPLALSKEDAPNVIVAVTLLGQDDEGNPDFRQGYVNLPVNPSFEYLNVELTSQPERAGPGDAVTFDMRITDANGSPVQGEFSLSVVDLAVLALANPNSDDILSFFYGEQPLSVRTGISLAASGQRLRFMPGGMGGGGGDGAFQSVTRENFPDTAYWDAQIVTDSDGKASVTMNLPDSLTTWQILVRGLTKETLVGESESQIITSKDLLIRPVTPRFLVIEDHSLLSAVVQNNTASELQGSATLQANGYRLDDPNSATQPVTIPAHGRTRLEWWGTAEEAASASLRFSVQAGNLQDAVLVSKGALPVLRYTAPQTFATSGSLAEDGKRLELVSLPVTYDANNGSLDVELDPSLAAALLDTLDVLENYPYDSSEQILSRFLPNLVTYTTLQTFGIESPDLKARLDRTLNQGLEHLLSLQRSDGGWGWWQGDESDAYISAYVLYGLAIARDQGISISTEAFDKAVSYVAAQMFTPKQETQAWELDRLVFENYALMKAGSVNLNAADALYAVRDQLSPWSRGFLALTLNVSAPNSEKVQTLLSDLQASAIRSATGVHWEIKFPDWRNMTSTLSNSAMVVYSLAQLEPASTILPDAVNFIMSNREASGFWGSSYEDAWILLSMNEVMKGTGELTSNYAFSSSLNGSPVASGQAEGATQLNPVSTSLPISKLYPHDPNSLLIERGPGNGRLYYTAALNVHRPVEDVSPLDHGINVSRLYFTPGSNLKTASPVSSAKVGDMLTARLTVVLTNDAYHFVIEDYIPAGTEILNTSLKTAQIGVEGEVGPLYDPQDPYSTGWGWWLFNAAQIYDDHISWTAAYLPAGTYTMTYTLVVLQEGEYRVLPAHAWMSYFPEVEGNSAGSILEIKP